MRKDFSSYKSLGAAEDSELHEGRCDVDWIGCSGFPVGDKGVSLLLWAKQRRQNGVGIMAQRSRGQATELSKRQLDGFSWSKEGGWTQWQQLGGVSQLLPTASGLCPPGPFS